MEDNKECSLIKDLFPIYIDNLTTKETNEFINNHFSKCNKCLNEYNNVLKKLQDNDYKKTIINNKQTLIPNIFIIFFMSLIIVQSILLIFRLF